MSLETEATYENGVLKPDQPLPLDDKQRVRIAVWAAEANGHAACLRHELARDLLAWVDQLVLLSGDVTLGTQLQFLKRGLARCHNELKGHPAEAAYLSIITLVESALTQLTWKQYTPARLATIRKVLEVGCREGALNFGDFDHARRLMAAPKFATTPRIDLASLTPEDLADDETGEA